MSELPPRTPWPPDFPDVVTHTSIAERDQHPCYAAAKAGDGQAAVALARDLVKDHAVTLLRQIIGERKPLLAPVSALETKGFNALPDALAQVIGEKLGAYIARQPTFDTIASVMGEAAKKARGGGLSTVALEELNAPPQPGHPQAKG